MSIAHTITRKTPNGPQRYTGSGSHCWENVLSAEEVGRADEVTRLRVPGGWIYRTAVGVTFVPMPEVVGYQI